MSNNCLKCGVTKYKMGVPFCNDDFCRNNITNNKQTAIDQLFEMIESIPTGRNAVDRFKEFILSKKSLYKQIEKEQLSNAFYKDRLTADIEIGLKVNWEFEEYYKQTYEVKK